ncbi:MAG TPA: GNAT family N-acetyltransferase [Chloroflexia bacterium]|nr:GNAT family N-acetyltransferase [Chloroflexia bacterium]
MSESGLDAQIQNYLRVAASRGRETERIGPFLATFTGRDPNPYLNYAIPDDGALPTSRDASDLIAAFEQRSRTPRLEYITLLATGVEGPLLGAGFVEEGRLPLMVCVPGSEARATAPEGIELVMPQSDTELLGLINAQNEAYGGEPNADLEAAARMRARIDDGEIAILARDIETGEPAGGGVCTIPQGGMTEVAAIGVRPGFRRRGIAEAVTRRLASEAFKAGVTLAFLMAVHEAEARIYARAGFSRVGEILHISRPS